MQIYVTKVKEEDKNQFSILFPPNLNFIEVLNLKDEELLYWIVDGETITIKKKVD